MVLMKNETVKKKWKEYFEQLLKEYPKEVVEDIPRNVG